jgi:hypothetical protein
MPGVSCLPRFSDERICSRVARDPGGTVPFGFQGVQEAALRILRDLYDEVPNGIDIDRVTSRKCT